MQSRFCFLFFAFTTIALATITSDRLLAQAGPPGDPTTAMTIDPGDPIGDDPGDGSDTDVAGDPSYSQPQEPFMPDLPDTNGNYEGPVGVTGIFNGNVETGCSYDPLSHSSHRAIDDIVVPGSIGKYPLKMTRYYNSRQLYYAAPGAIGLSPGWAYEYSWLLWSAGHKVVSPHGSVYDDYCGAPLGVSEGWEQRTDASNGTWRLADGGKVVFSSGRVTDIYDPYGQRTRIAYDGSGQRVKVTEPGGRCLWFIYNDQDQDGTKLLTRVQAHDADGSPGSPTAPTGHLIDWVNYTYTACDPGVQNRPWKKMLTGVGYSDGTSAIYQYRTDNVHEGQTSHKMYPLLKRCDDVRYNGPMRTIYYEYQADGPHGAIIDEKYPGIGAVSAIGPALPVGDYVDNFTETRGDGPSRSFTYTHIHHCTGPECGPCDDEGTNGPNQQMLLNYTDFKGHTTYIGYDPNTWYITSVRDANSHTTYYERNAGLGAVTKITHPGGTHIDYAYYNEGTGYIGGHYIQQVTNERGAVTYYHRDGNYRVTQIDYDDNQNPPNIIAYETFTYNPFGEVLNHRLKNGAYERFAYDTRGLLTDKWNPKQDIVPADNDPHTHYDYYVAWPWGDRVRKETLPANISGQVATETYEYDKDASNPPNAVAGRGLVTKVLHADTKYRTASYSQFGNKMWDENEKRERTTYAYDNYNRLKTATDPLSHITKHDYASTQGNSIQCYLHTTNSPYWVTTPALILTKNLYDENFRKTSTTAASGTLNLTTTFIYDYVGNLIWVTDPNNHSTYNIYDARNRKVSATEAAGTNLAATTVWHYDGVGNINQIDRPDSTHETKGFDALNRMAWRVVPQGPTVDLPTWFGYNSSGTIQWVKDANYNVTTFAYDASDRKNQMTYPGNSQSQAWNYDNAGNLASRTAVGGETQNFTYDIRNRKTAMSWSNGADSASYGYDDVGRLTAANNPNSQVTRAYDAAGRLTQDQQNVTGLGTQTVYYPGYDADDRLTRMYVANMYYDYTFGYDPAGRFGTISPTGGSAAFQYSYDGASNLTHRDSNFNGITIDQYTPRDSLNRIAGRWLKNNGTPFAAQGYTYDRANDLTNVVWGSVSDAYGYYWNNELLWCEYGVRTNGPQQVPEQDPDLDTTDNVDPWAGYQPPGTEEPEPTPPPTSPSDSPGTQIQLPYIAQFDRGVVYYMDKGGNRTSVYDTVSGTTAYSPNALNQYTGSAGGAAISNGNEHEVNGYNSVTYSYINDEHLKQVTSGSNTYNLYYDALGRCVKRKLNNVTTYYVYDGEKPVLEYNGSGTLFARNIYGKGVDEILARLDITVNGGQWFYYGQDHEGSVTHLIDGTPNPPAPRHTGDVIESYKYDAFGAPTMYNGSGAQITSTAYNNRFLFTGREYAASYLGTYVPAFNFYEYRARAYNPTLGRFMSEDPKLFDANDYNLFRYCHNDPLDLTDAMGTETNWAGAGPQAPGNHSAMEREVDITIAERISLWQKSMETSIGGEQASSTLQSLGQMPKLEKANPEASQLRSIDPSHPRTMKEFILAGNKIEHGNTMDTTPIVDPIDILSGGIAGMARSGALRAAVWPTTAEEMNAFLKVEGRAIADTLATPGRNKTVWELGPTKLTLEQHPYHPNAPSWHTGPHWHLELPGNPRQRFLPGDPMPGY